MATRATAPALKQPARLPSVDVREHYDGLARLYRVFWGDNLHHGLFAATDDVREAQLAMLEYCSGLLPGVAYLRILDVGCGYGTTALYLAKRYRAVAEGISISPKQIAYAQRLAERGGFASRVKFHVADAEDHQYPNARYDLIWAMESTEHFADKQNFFLSASHALRRGGAMMVAAWTAGDFADRDELQALAKESSCASFATAGEYRSMMSNAGLSVVNCRDITRDVEHTWKVVESRVRWVRPFSLLLPKVARDFSKAIPRISEAFRLGKLNYTVMVAQRQF